MRRDLLYLLVLLISSTAVIAQQTISGTIRDETNEPLIGATVLITGTTTGAVTDIEGKFTVSVNAEAESLTISYIGFKSKTVSLDGQTNFDIQLEAGTELAEVVVTALGLEEKKASLSYATQRIDAESFNVSRIGDISQQLSAQIPGLSITTGNGSGVSSSRIVLRGEASLNIDRNQPLIVLDGVVVSNNLDGIAGTSANGWTNNPVDYGNGLTDFNTDDIADVTVLKGPKAAALYGARASNGALIIRTKSGKDKVGIGIEFNTGVSFERVGNFWDEQTQYGGGFSNEFRPDWGGNYGAINDGSLIEQPTAYQFYDGETVQATPYTHKLDRKGFFETGTALNNSIGISFSNDGTWGRVSLARLDKTSIVPNTDYERTNASVRLGSVVNEQISVDVSAHYVSSGSDNLPTIGAGGEGIINNMFWAMNNYDYNDFRSYWEDDIPYSRQNYFLSWGTNPFLIAYENLNSFDRNRLFGNIKVTYDFNDRLSLFVRIGTDFYTDKRRSQRAPGQPNFNFGMFREQLVGYQESNYDFLLTYNNKINDDIGFKVSAGGNRLDQHFSNDLFQTNRLGIPGIYSKSNADDTPFLSQNDRSKRINSFYGFAQIDYQQKIFLDVTSRGDWSSALPDGNQFFFYPSVGLSAVLSEMIDLPTSFSFLQLRASYAETGNDFDPGATQAILPFGSLPGSIVNSSVLIDPELQPERTSAFEIGAEVKMFQNNLGLDINYYRNSTTNQILSVPTSQSTGANSILTNAGEIVNKGIELFITGTPIKRGNFSWNTSLAWTRNRGEVVSLAPDLETFIYAQGASGGSVQARPGERMGDIYGRGYLRSPEGDIILEVVNDGTRDVVRPVLDNEVQNLGNYNPDWTAGLTNSFRFRGVDLRILLDYRKGGVLVSNTSALLYRSGIITESESFREEDFVPVGVIDNGDGTFTPNTTATSGQDWYRSNFNAANLEANTYDATFLKLREISLGIDLTPWVYNLPIETMHLSFFGRNLWIHTKDDFLRHFDPEALTMAGGTLVPGFEVGQFPNPRVFGANLKVQF
ncbi:MAG: SusC/RagA family TonB-linked outer membrane protein [Bacteroidota bacterium]